MEGTLNPRYIHERDPLRRRHGSGPVGRFRVATGGLVRRWTGYESRKTGTRGAYDEEVPAYREESEAS